VGNRCTKKKKPPKENLKSSRGRGSLRLAEDNKDWKEGLRAKSSPRLPVLGKARGVTAGVSTGGTREWWVGKTLVGRSCNYEKKLADGQSPRIAIVGERVLTGVSC